MWNNQSCPNLYRSIFLLVRIRSGRFRLTLPLALFLIAETLTMIADLLWLANKIMPVRIGEGSSTGSFKKIGPKFYQFRKPGSSPDEIFKLCRELLDELRRHGRYPLVEVETGAGSHKHRVSVEIF